MVNSCSDHSNARNEDASVCSCIPTRVVEEDLERRTNPFGKDQTGCFKVEQEMVFKGITGELVCK